MADQNGVQNPQYGELNSVEHSNEPESLEPENLNGIDLIQKNNHNLTKPNVIKKIVGPFKGIVFKGSGDVTKIEKKAEDTLSNSFLKLVGGLDLVKCRIRIPELHSHLPEPDTDLGAVPPRLASMYPEFIAQTTNLTEASAGTIVWCNFLDRENFKEPVYLGPLDDKSAGTAGGSSPGATTAGDTSGLSGSPGKGDPFGGTSYKNAAGQVSYPAISGDWSGELPINGFTATTATVEDLIKLAKEQIGKKESIVDNKGTNGGPEIDPFNGGRYEAWCNAGISWCFRKIGAPLPGDKLPFPTPGLSPPAPPPNTIKRGYPDDLGWNKMHSVFFTEKYFKALNSWFSEPQAGDMVIYNTDKDRTKVDSTKHIGLVIKVDGDIIETIEFNWGTVVYKTKQNWKTFQIWNEQGQFWKESYPILGFARRPLPYAGVPDGKLVQAPVQTSDSDSIGGEPGMYEVVTSGKSEGLVEMVNVEGTKLLYPKKYIRALESMRRAYKQETGQTLRVVSAYRDVGLQKQLYDAYLARRKAPPQVAPPGYSLHNNGRAVDLGTGQPHNGNYERDSVPKPTRDVAESWAKSGKYGPVAKWLVENSRRFGYIWAGYSFRELWHYELDVNSARSLGLVDG